MADRLNVMAPINRTSYGIVSFYLIKHLCRIGADISLFPIGSMDKVEVSQWAGEDIGFLQRSLDNASKYDPIAPSLKIWHQHSLADSIGRGKRLAYSFFEIDLQENEVYHINQLDHFIVASSWARRLCIDSGVKTRVDIVYPAVDGEVKTTQNSVRDDKVVKYLVCGKWEKRKCHDLIAKCFGEAFDSFDSVQLDYLSHNPFCSSEEHEQWHMLVKDSPMGHKVNILPPIQRHRDLLNLYSEYDVFIGVSRAEGFFLPLLEAMKAGCLCIASDCTAQSDYISDTNCIIVKPVDMVKAHDGKWFKGQGEWADFDSQDIVEAMQKAKVIIEENTKIYDDHIAKAIKTANSFTWERSAKEIMKIAIE